MNRIKLSVATTLAAALIVSPATAYADDVPSVDQAVAVLAELTDPDIPAGNKTDIVTPGFSPEEAETIDNHLNRSRGPQLPLHFIVTDIQPAPNNFAGATVATVGNPRQSTYARPIVLVDQGGHWMISHDSAMTELYWFWQAAARKVGVVP
jgi:hypothetical protein